MGRRRCKFIASWLVSGQFSGWLEELDGDRHKARCSLCDKVFSIAHGGLHDVRSHWKGKRHAALEEGIAGIDDWRDGYKNNSDEMGENISDRPSNRCRSTHEDLPFDYDERVSPSTFGKSRNPEMCMDLEMHQEKEFIPRRSNSKREARVNEEKREEERETVEVDKQSQKTGNSFWPSENLEEFVEAEDEDVREIDEFENSDSFNLENQPGECSDHRLGRDDDSSSDDNLGTEEATEEEAEKVVVVEEEEVEEEEEVGEEEEEEEEVEEEEEGIERVKFEVESASRYRKEKTKKKKSRSDEEEEVVVVVAAAVPGSRMLREDPTISGTPGTGAQTPTMSNMFPQQYCLRWKYHHSNLQTMFSQLLERQAYCDVTLACEGQTLRAHKVVLSACSTYFDTILSQYEEKDPIVIMRDVKFSDIKVLVEFMYKGEINIDHTRLSSLLKTAEDLHIKGLAEVSWRSDSAQNDVNSSGHSPGAGTPGVETVLREGDLDEPPPPKQRRRGRPPLDDPPSAHDVFTPKITCFTGNEEMMSEGDHESCDDEMINENNEAQPPALSYLSKDDSASDQEKKTAPNTPSNSNATNPAIPEQFRDVIKMNDYLTTGRRQEFWEEPFTRRVMDAIKSKELEMKTAAEILGVSYGTLYGRYRDSYGCLKHPYRVRDFWSEPGPAEVLAKLRRKEITLFRAAEFLNVTVHTLATYLSTLQGPDRISLAGELSAATSGLDANDMEANESVNDILQKFNATAAMAATPTTSATIKREGGGYVELPSIVPKAASSVLENNPDITIVKTESLQQQQQRKRDYSKVSNTENNNAKLMSGGAVSEIAQQQQKLSDALSLNNDNSKP